MVEHESIELDYCVGCQGIWFDSTELELLFHKLGLDEAMDVSRLMKDATGKTTEKARKCPLCRRKMQKLLIGTEADVLIDGCPAGEGLWFDGGELPRLIQQLVNAPGAGGKVVTFLGETFRGKIQEDESAAK